LGCGVVPEVGIVSTDARPALLESSLLLYYSDA